MTSHYNSKIGMGLFHEQSFTVLLYFFSVLITHNGFVYDFPLLFAEVDRRYPLLKNDLFKRHLLWRFISEPANSKIERF